jgi:hypothetical protein
MYVRKVFEFAVLWSEGKSLPGDEDEWHLWVIDWRWFCEAA